MITQEQLSAHYQKEADALLSRINTLKARGRAFVVAEIATFAAIIFLVALTTISDTPLARTIEGALAVTMFGLYVIVRNRDVKNSESTAEAERLKKAYEHEVAYLAGDFSAFDDGQRYANPHHPFTYDMDIFGKESLYQRINRTVTTGGADRLAHYLGSVDAHKTVEEINDYSNAIKSLSSNTPRPDTQEDELPANDDATSWRMYFISCGVDRKINTDAILQALPELRKIAIPPFFGGKGIKVAAWLLSVGIICSIAAAIYGLANPMLPITWLFINFFATQWLANKHLKKMLSLGNHLQNQMQPLMRLVRHTVARHHERHAGNGTSILEREWSKLDEATSSFATLTNIVETLTLRGNGTYRFLSDALALRGILLTCSFYRWRRMAADNLPEWIAAIDETDALASMAQMRANHPEATDATATDSASVEYEASGLWHPFLGKKAVRNDFSIKDRNFYTITGANMAGKSTFLRAIGVNYILAMNGMPVFAESLTVSRYRLFTSMRTSDDLAHGISYFNAELLRLRQLLESLAPTAHERPTLIILDEILKGTNSLDKLNGSRLFLQNITQYPVSGIIATHDLELSKMEQEDPRFHNYCFEIELGTDVAYSYKITAGVARNQNATFLLKQILDNH